MRTFRDVFGNDPLVRLVAPSTTDADMGAELTESPPPAEDAPLVEGSAFVSIEVPASESTGFTHFLDGAQKSWRAMFLGFLPVTLSHTSAALLHRGNRLVEPPCTGNYLGGLEGFVPDVEGLPAKVRTIVPVESIPVADDDTGLVVALRTKKAIESKRKARELDLCEGFSEGCLLVDGGLGEALERLSDDVDVVGLVKSHQRQYFKSRDRQLVILNLKPGQRTTVFLRESSSRQGKACYSFYMKLREKPGQGPIFGLARIEVPATERNLTRVNEIASWILAERAPLSLPDPRFHVLLYPIHLVEEHLKSRQPSEAVIRGLVGL